MSQNLAQVSDDAAVASSLMMLRQPSQPSQPAEEDSQPISLMQLNTSDGSAPIVENEHVMQELKNHGLTNVVRTKTSQGTEDGLGIDPDYFLRLINCLRAFYLQIQKETCADFIVQRRAAFKAQDWDRYADINNQLFNEMQFGFEPVLKTASVSLGISEAEFIAIYQELQEGEWAEQLRLAD